MAEAAKLYKDVQNKIMAEINKLIQSKDKEINELKEENKSIKEENKSIKEENKMLKQQIEICCKAKQLAIDRINDLNKAMEQKVARDSKDNDDDYDQYQDIDMDNPTGVMAMVGSKKITFRELILDIQKCNASNKL